MQAERVRVPFANVGMLRLPDDVRDDQAILLSDIFPTGWFAAELAEVTPGDTVAVFGCGPVGQFAILSAKLLGAARVLAVDTIHSRLERAREQGAEVIDFNAEDPIETIRALTGGIGVDRAIDAVGIDAVCPHKGPAAQKLATQRQQFEAELDQIAPDRNPHGGNWQPGDAPSLVLSWAVDALCKAGTLAVVGVYPPAERNFPIGTAMLRNLTIRMGNCNHRKYLPKLLELVQSGAVDPTRVLTQREPLTSAIDAYKAFDARKPGWLKVELTQGQKAA
jgi:threonine dehydrogenase-like Zn-dependent dehydrogenase